MVTEKEFDWTITNKPLVVFIPNYGRGEYIRGTLNQFKTNLSTDQYSIIIGNDRRHEDFSDLKDNNIFYFTLSYNPQNIPRNGCFIRNYFIKRCQSQYLFQKDPETILEMMDVSSQEDWMSRVIAYLSRYNIIYRPANTVEETQPGVLGEIQTLTPTRCPHPRVHWGFGVRTSSLVEINGYDEDFTVYGPEDKDCYNRLINKLGQIGLDTHVIAKHLWHPILPEVYHQCQQMEWVASRKDPTEIIRNPNGWGEG